MPAIRTGKSPACPLRGLYDGTEAEAKPALDPVLNTARRPAQGCRDLDPQASVHKAQRDAAPDGEPARSGHAERVDEHQAILVEGWLINEHHSAERWRDVVEHFLNAPDKTCFIALEFYGGAIAERAPTDMAFVHRDPVRSTCSAGPSGPSTATGRPASIGSTGLGSLQKGMGSGAALPELSATRHRGFS